MYQATRVLPYPAHFLKDIVANVKEYPKFLPMLKSAIIFPETENSFQADLTISSGAFEKNYRSKVFVSEYSVKAQAVPDKIFKFLESQWHFYPHEENHCKVEFMLHFELRSTLLQLTVGKFLDKIAAATMTAFEERAKDLWKILN